MLAAMGMMFGPNDEDAFLATRAALLDRFGRWLRDQQQTPEQHAAEMAGDAGLALDWKWSYFDGHLGTWRTRDVHEFLLEWCPRKLSVSQADCLSIPGSLVAFSAFLHAEGLLSPGSSSLAALAETAAALAEEFVAAMGDASNFGLAKSLFSAASADGVDMSDPDRVQTWMAEFNARPEQERRRVIPDSALAAPTRPVLPPVTLPGDAEVAASQAAAPILETFVRFASFVGAGRKLTQTGNLTLADARALVDLLGTGDAIDERIGDRTFKTRSAAELPRLGQIVAWARKAGVVRVAHGRVIATKAGLAMAGDPAAFFDRAVDALLAIGPLTSQRDPNRWLAWPEVNELLDRFALHLLAGPYVAQRPVPIGDLASVAAGAVLDVFEFASLGDDDVARRVGNDVVDVIDALELAGMVRRSGITEEPATKVIGRLRQGGCVELTAAGMATTQRSSPSPATRRPPPGASRQLRQPSCWSAPTWRTSPSCGARSRRGDGAWSRPRPPVSWPMPCESWATRHCATWHWPSWGTWTWPSPAPRSAGWQPSRVAEASPCAGLSTTASRTPKHCSIPMIWPGSSTSWPSGW